MSWFLNPYNFSPLLEPVRRQPLADWFKGPLYSGWLTYQLDPLSPVALPDPRYRQASDKPQEQFFPFFGYESDVDVADKAKELGKIPPVDKKELLPDYDPNFPIIPGSEMRGMLRAAHAAFANGCLTQLDTNRALGRRSSVALTESAFLVARIAEEKKGAENLYGQTIVWTLEKAERFKLKSNLVSERTSDLHDKLKDEDIICFKTNDDHVDWRWPATPVLKSFMRHVALEDKLTTGERTGMVHRSNSISLKVFETVFSPIPVSPLKEGKDAADAANAFFNTLMHYEESRNDMKTYSRTYKRMDQLLHRPYELAGERFPMYFPLYHDKDYTVFSPAMISYRPSRKQVADLLADTKHGPCTAAKNACHMPEETGTEPDGTRSKVEASGKVAIDPAVVVSSSDEPLAHICPTCALFGRILGSTGWAGSLRFSDMVPLDKKDLPARYETIALPELSTPRVTSTEFYLERPKEAGKSPSVQYPAADQNAWWDFDQVQSGNNQPEHYAGGRLQGRKFYWHHSGYVLPRSDKNASDASRSVTVRALRSTSDLEKDSLDKDMNRLEGRIWFDRVPLDTVQQLVWLLTLGDRIKTSSKIPAKAPVDEPAVHAHHIGMGKPVGLGSVKFRPVELQMMKDPAPATTDEGQVTMSRVDLTDVTTYSQWQDDGAQAFARCRQGVVAKESSDTKLGAGAESVHGATVALGAEVTGETETARHFLEADDVKALLMLHDFYIGDKLRAVAEEHGEKRKDVIRYPTGVRRGEQGIHYFFVLNRNMGKTKPFPFHQVLKRPYELKNMSEKETLRDMLLMEMGMEKTDGRKS